MIAMCWRCLTCEAEAERVDASILASDLYQVRLLPIRMRDRRHDQCHIGVTAEEDGETNRWLLRSS